MMTSKNLVSMLCTSGAALLFAACSQPCPPVPEPPPAPDMNALTAQIQAMEDAYATAEKAKNIDGIMVYYADDVMSHMNERATVSGKENLRASMAERMAKDSTAKVPTFKVQELFVGNDHMTEIGSWSNADANGVEMDHGTYISIFRKKGDGWECVREMAVSAKPKEEKKN